MRGHRPSSAGPPAAERGSATEGGDTPAEEALPRIGHALTAVGVPEASATALAEHLIDARAWGLSS